jgi:death-on-curing protein
MEYLQKEDIILINRMTTERHGGNFTQPFNFLNEAPLDYLIEAVQSEMFGSSLYPEIKDKAGLYMFNIISNHIFQDGNKRTGLESAILFLRLNNYDLKVKLSKIEINGKNIPISGESNQEILTEFTLEIASSIHTLEECQIWFEKNIIKTR